MFQDQKGMEIKKNQVASVHVMSTQGRILQFGGCRLNLGSSIKYEVFSQIYCIFVHNKARVVQYTLIYATDT